MYACMYVYAFVSRVIIYVAYVYAFVSRVISISHCLKFWHDQQLGSRLTRRRLIVVHTCEYIAWTNVMRVDLTNGSSLLSCLWAISVHVRLTWSS